MERKIKLECFAALGAVIIEVLVKSQLTLDLFLLKSFKDVFPLDHIEGSSPGTYLL